MNASEAFLAEPLLLGGEDLLDVLRRARGRSFLVSSPPEGGAIEVAALLARFWLGAMPQDDPPDLEIVDDPRMADIRRLLQDVWTLPVARDRKAVVVALGARPSREVLNALLRLTEEPPEHLGVFVASLQPRLLPATLSSRLLPLRLRPVGAETIRDWLASRQVTAERAARLTAVSGGWMAKILRLLDEEPTDILGDIGPRIVSSPFSFVEVQEAIGKDRKAWLGKLRGEMEGLLRATSDPRYLRATAAASLAQRDLEANVNGALVVENLLLALERIGVFTGGDGAWGSEGARTSSSISSNARTDRSTRGPREIWPDGS